jgi:acetamidase/formamidase
VSSLPVDASGGRPQAEWDVDMDAGSAVLTAPQSNLGAYTFAVAPMIGCMGVAPNHGQAISTATSAEHGGNMDYRGFVEGVTAYFPVFAPGALFFLGDAHALQGDGEMAGTGVEISCDVTFRVRVQKARRIGWPRGENATHIFTLGNARPLDQAVQHATTEMARWLEAEYKLDPLGAQTLMGQTVAYELGNMYDPAYTFVCKMEKRLLAALPHMK